MNVIFYELVSVQFRMIKSSSNMKRTIKIIRWVARSLSVIIILFHALSFLGDNSMNRLIASDILKLVLWGILLVGLVIAWKWERTGSLIILGVTLLQFIINPVLITVWVMWIAPFTGFLFFFVGLRMEKEK